MEKPAAHSRLSMQESPSCMSSGREQHNSPQQATSNRKAFVQRLSPKEKPFVPTRLCPVIWPQWFLQTGSALLGPERGRPCGEGAEGPTYLPLCWRLSPGSQRHSLPVPHGHLTGPIVDPTPVEPGAQTALEKRRGQAHHVAGPVSCPLCPSASKSSGLVPLTLIF